MDINLLILAIINQLGVLVGGIAIATILENKDKVYMAPFSKVTIKNIALFLLLILASCRWFKDAATPFLMGDYMRLPQGTPTFQQGYKDGCGTSLYTRGNVFYRTIHKINYNPKLIDNPEYRFGYSRGYTTCFQIVVGGASAPQASFDAYLNYGTTFDMSGGGNINNLWGGFFSNGIMQGDVTNSNVNLDSVVNIWQNAERGGGTVFGSNPIWAGGSAGQFFGQ